MKEVKKTGCPLNCIDGCQWLVSVENGEITGIQGGLDNPVTKGFVCSKATAQWRRMDSIDRITYPMYRQHTQQPWQRISWEKAYDIMAQQLTRIKQQWGTTAIYHHYDYGTNGVLSTLDQRFFNAFGGVTEHEGSICWGSGYKAQQYDFGQVVSSDWSDLVNAKTIILWGRDPAVTSVHMMPYLKEAAAKGTKIIVINPIQVKSASLAQQFVSVKPGTDGALALGIAHIILQERWLDVEFVHQYVHGFAEYAQLVHQYPPAKVSHITGVSEEEMRQLAHAIAKEKPTSIIIGYGLQRYENGGKTVRAIDSLLAITGNIGKPGACAHYAQGVNNLLLNDVVGSHLAVEKRRFPVSQIGRRVIEADDPPIKAIFVTRSNPLSQLPNTTKVRAAFNQVDFVAVADFFLNDTAEMANLFLPVTTVFEQLDLISTSWNNYITLVEPIVAPKGGAKPDWQIFSELAVKMGLKNFWPFAIEMDKLTEKGGAEIGYQWIEFALATATAKKGGITLEALKKAPLRNPLAPQVAWQDLQFKTPTGKIELYSQQAQEDTGFGLASYEPNREIDLDHIKSEYPYLFMTPHAAKSIHSQFTTEQETNWSAVKLHPTTAKQLYVSNMDKVIVESPRGAMTGTVQIDSTVPTDTVVVEEGRWHKFGGGVNFLTGDHIADMGQGTPFYDCRCRVIKIIDDF